MLGRARGWIAIGLLVHATSGCDSADVGACRDDCGPAPGVDATPAEDGAADRDTTTPSPDAGATDGSPPEDLGRPDPDAAMVDDAGGVDDGSVVDAAPPADAGAPPPFVISNEADFGPLRETGLVTSVPSGEIDTDSDCNAGALVGRCEVVIAPLGMGEACVCRADAMTIGDVRVVGSRAIVLLAWRTIEVASIDVGGALGAAGPGSVERYEHDADGRAGGAGGTFATIGGASSVDVYGNAELVPLVGGMTGQNGCGARASGGGGGAIQLAAGERIVVTGGIHAGGGGGEGGWSGDSCHGGAGGGSGGAILVEAPSVELAGAVTAHGGGGGSGGTSSFTGRRGDDSASLARATGGSSQSEDSCALGDIVFSGYGGDGATSDSPAGFGGSIDEETICLPDADTFAGAGGGGGGLGRIRINTADGARGCACSATVSPDATFGIIP